MSLIKKSLSAIIYISLVLLILSCLSGCTKLSEWLHLAEAEEYKQMSISEIKDSCIIKEKDIGRDDKYVKELSVVEDKLYELDEDASNLVVKYYKNKLKQLEHEFCEIQK